jgi:flagellar protein FliS
MSILSTPQPHPSPPVSQQAQHEQSLRARFVDDGLETASGPKIIQLCYERLDRDLAAALEALEAPGRVDITVAHETLRHAQDIVHELLCMLDVDRWEHGRSLAAIYRYVLELLTQANVKKNAAPAREARHLMGELGEAFRMAATVPMAAPEPAGAGVGAGRVGQFSASA